MTVEQVEAILETHGKDCCVAIVFDNSRKCHIQHNQNFDDKVTLDATNQTLVGLYEGPTGHQYKVVEDIGSIQALIFVTKPEDKQYYQRSVL